MKLFLLDKVFLLISLSLPEGSCSNRRCLGLDALGCFEAAGTAKFLQRGEKASDGLLGSGDDYLQHFPLCHCAAAKPHAVSVCQYALYGRRTQAVFGCVGSSWRSSGSEASAVPALLLLLCLCSRSGPL